jgi:hypothetical protein
MRRASGKGQTSARAGHGERGNALSHERKVGSNRPASADSAAHRQTRNVSWQVEDRPHTYMPAARSPQDDPAVILRARPRSAMPYLGHGNSTSISHQMPDEHAAEHTIMLFQRSSHDQQQDATHDNYRNTGLNEPLLGQGQHAQQQYVDEDANSANEKWFGELDEDQEGSLDSQFSPHSEPERCDFDSDFDLFF